MTYAEMVDFISTELGLYDVTSLRLMKLFINKAYSTLWDRYPWVDTQMGVELQVAANAQYVEYPENIDRIITIFARSLSSTGSFDPEQGWPADLYPQTDAHFLEPVTATFLVETDPDIHLRIGVPIYYEEKTFNPSFDIGPKRILLLPRPSLPTTLGIVGKVRCIPLLADTDTSLIRNIDPAIIAYAYADMLQRQRQFGKAEVKRKEAQELEQVAWNLEQQQANQPRRTKSLTVGGNSLAEMTDAVCAICGQWTPDYRLIIKEFLRRNYQTLYDTYLWPESLVVIRVPFTSEQVVMPWLIDKVLGVRGTSDQRMFPADAGLFLDISPSIFDEIGEPIGYTTLTPVAVSTLPQQFTYLYIQSESPVDTSPVMIRGEIISTGRERTETINLNGTHRVTSNFAYDIPLTISKEITVGDVTINAAHDGQNLEIIPADMREMKHQRLWFLPIPDESKLDVNEFFYCLVLGKRVIRPLLTDQDTPIITGVQQALIAAAAADLFRKLEKHDMATAMLQKADGSMNVLKNKNLDQAASSPRFVPQVEPHAYVAGCTW